MADLSASEIIMDLIYLRGMIRHWQDDVRCNLKPLLGSLEDAELRATRLIERINENKETANA